MAVDLGTISAGEMTPLVVRLLEIIRRQDEQLAELRDEIARLKGHKPRPVIKPGTLEGPPPGGPPPDPPAGKRPGSEKRSKTAELPIHETKVVPPAVIPPGSTYKGHQDYVVQDLEIRSRNICYRLERWLTPTGEYLVGELPAPVRTAGHFGPELRRFILYQYHQLGATQPRLLEQLREMGVDLSAGQLHNLLTENQDLFHQEKDDLLPAGLATSAYVNVDDTGARHAGKNGYCTHIGNEFFAWFASTQSKSRINFLELLRTGHRDYVLNDEAFAYLREQGLPQGPLELLATHAVHTFADPESWGRHLDALGIVGEKHRRIATEGGLLGSVLEHGLHPNLVIVSDDAGQFNILRHALCWVHAERTLNKLITVTDEQRAAVEAVRADLWRFYADLKAYKTAPDPAATARLEARFQALFSQQTGFESLNDALARLLKNKAELLLVLQRPEIPLHNNTSERDIREYVHRRKISGGTRSDAGRRCRDTFTSLKKTCRKLCLSFWDYLLDRLTGLGAIAPLAELLRLRAAGSG